MIALMMATGCDQGPDTEPNPEDQPVSRGSWDLDPKSATEQSTSVTCSVDERNRECAAVNKRNDVLATCIGNPHTCELKLSTTDEAVKVRANCTNGQVVKPMNLTDDSRTVEINCNPT